MKLSDIKDSKGNPGIETIGDSDIRCMGAAIKLLAEEGYNRQTVDPKKRLLKKLERIKANGNKHLTVDVEALEQSVYDNDIITPCEGCGGNGHLGKHLGGKYISCELCGGHEDSLGNGIFVDYEKLAKHLSDFIRLDEEQT